MTERRLEVNGSLLTDATCGYFSDVSRVPLFSGVNFSLLCRYMMQSTMTNYPGVPRVPWILDIGCNNGAALKMHASSAFQRPGRKAVKYHGFDLHEPSIRAAKSFDWKAPNSRIALDPFFTYCDITLPWNIASEVFDVIWYTETIEHVPPTLAMYTLQEAYRVARPGAWMMLATPSSQDGTLVWPESHDHEFSQTEVRHMLHGTGWTITDEWAMDADFQAVRTWLRNEKPDEFKTYETIRKRAGASVAKVALMALMPEIGRDFVYMCRKEVRDVESAVEGGR